MDKQTDEEMQRQVDRREEDRQTNGHEIKSTILSFRNRMAEKNLNRLK